METDAEKLPKPRQRGFYEHEDAQGSSLGVKAQRGDRMIKPKEERKKRKRGLTPFEEVAKFIAQKHAWEDGVGQYEYMNEDGDMVTVTVGPDVTYNGPVQGVKAVKRPNFESLSPKAKGLWFEIIKADEKRAKQMQGQPNSPGPLIPGVHFDPYASEFPGVNEEGVDWDKLTRMVDYVKRLPKK